MQLVFWRAVGDWLYWSGAGGREVGPQVTVVGTATARTLRRHGWVVALLAFVPLWQPLRPAWGPRVVVPQQRLLVPTWPGQVGTVPVWVVPRDRGIPEDAFGRPLVPGRGPLGVGGWDVDD